MTQRAASGSGLFVPCGEYLLQVLVGRRTRFIFERREAEDHLSKPGEVDTQRVLARKPFCKFPGEAFHVAPCEGHEVTLLQRAYFLKRSLMRPQWRLAMKLSTYAALLGPSLW